jgi:hypothetical protein
MTSFRAGVAIALAGLSVVVGAGVAAASPSTQGAIAAPRAPGDPVALTLVVPLTVPPNSTGLLDADTLTRYTSPLGLLTRQLDAVIDTPVAIGLDPQIIASIRVLGTSAPPSALGWLDRLAGASNEVFALAYADADVAAAARAGALDQLSPLSFDFAIDPANFGEAQTATPTPTPTPSEPPEDPGDAIPPLPTTADILAWPYTIEQLAWPADDTITTAELDALGTVGYQAAILSSDNVADPAATLELGAMTGVVSDSSTSSLVRAAAYASTAAELEANLDALDAALTGEAAAAPGRSIVATLERRWPFTSYHLAEVISRLLASPSVTLGPLAAVVDATGVPSTVVDRPEDETRISNIRTALTAVADETAFATVLDDPLQLTAPRRLELLGLLTVAWLADDEGWSETLSEFLLSSDAIVSSVQLAQGSDLVLLARSTEVRVAVTNALPYPVTVRVSIFPTRPLLRVIENDVLLTIEGDATKTAFIPVEAITNGEVTIEVTLTSPTGVPIDSGFVRANLQAEWETVGTVAVLAVIVLVFGFGLARTIVKRRRAKAEAAAAGEASGANEARDD